LTIVRAWHVAPEAERRPLKQQWGSFEGWTAIVPQIAVWVGLANPLETRDDISESDEADGALRALLAAWKPIEMRAATNGMTGRELAENVFETDGRARSGCEDMAAALEQLAPGVGRVKVDVKRLGYVLRNVKGRVISGRKLVPATKGTGRWTVKP
jgi:hypothetical protein